MSHQLALAWPSDHGLPVSGRTPAARHASATGAAAAMAVRGPRAAALLRAFRRYGRLTIAEAATVTGLKESSVCSCWASLERVAWIEGTGTYQTYTTGAGRLVRREWHRLTRRGEEAAAHVGAEDGA